MDYRTLFIFDSVSLAIYCAVVVVLAVVHRRLVGMRWFAVSLLFELISSLLKLNRESIAPWAATLLPNAINAASVGACYLGFRWFLSRKPIRWIRVWLTLGLLCVVYLWLWFVQSRFALLYSGAPVFSLLTIYVLLRRGRGPYALAARAAACLILARGLVAAYRTSRYLRIVAPGHGFAISSQVTSDSHMLYATLAVMLLGASLLLIYFWFFVIEFQRELETSALTDPLTGLLNRRGLLRESRREIELAHRGGCCLSLVAIDLDHFKNVNDRFGHQAGDRALASFAAMLRAELREFDLVARYGGEEFVLILPGTPLGGAVTVTDKLRACLKSMPITFAGMDLGITFTAGVTEILSTDQTFDQMMERADAALYEGKAAERNCTVVDGMVFRPANENVFEMNERPSTRALTI